MAEQLTNINVGLTSATLGEIKSNKIKNGEIYFSHTGELFYDWQNSRIQITDIILVDTTSEYNALSKIDSKFYFVSDTTSLYYYINGESYLITNNPSIQAHISNNIVHITAAEREKWNAKTTLDIDETGGEVVNETIRFVR